MRHAESPETRDRKVERVAETVQETAQGTMDKVQRVAEEAGETVEKEARYQRHSSEESWH